MENLQTVLQNQGCFRKGTQILMFDGTFKSVEKIKIGDRLMGDDSNPREVQRLIRNNDLMYQITPDYGDPYFVNNLHNLVLKGIKDPYIDQILEIEVKSFVNKPQDFKDSFVLYKAILEFVDKKVDNDPYLLGLKLANTLQSNVDIDKSYLLNSKQKRILLASGIVDSSNVRFNNERFELLHPSTNFRNSVAFLTRSIGLKSVDYPDMRKLYIFGNIGILQTTIKRIKQPKIDEKYVACNFDIIDLEKEEDYFGFTIDGNHRFLLNSFDVVRNSGI